MTGKRVTILITDDDTSIRELLMQRLTEEGYECLGASSAHRAVEELRESEVALVILDIKMPGKSGVQLLPEIRASYPDTVVIMATAIGDAGTAIHCMRLGAYDYITKPFNLDEVVLSVNKALEKRRLELENRDYQQHLEQKVEAQSSKICDAFLNAITALIYALEAKDGYTSGHSSRVSRISVAIARELDLPWESINQVELAGRVHDIGKIGMREAVLNKPGHLTDEEFQHVKYHPESGERILVPIVEDKEILRIVRHHHECYNGTGYPDGLAGDEIPLGARILAVADSYDAMTSERPYRGAMSVETARAEIERGKGTQFDPEVAEAFLRSGFLPLRLLPSAPSLVTPD
jgi:putative two-component system response regulator